MGDSRERVLFHTHLLDHRYSSGWQLKPKHKPPGEEDRAMTTEDEKREGIIHTQCCSHLLWYRNSNSATRSNHESRLIDEIMCLSAWDISDAGTNESVC